MLKIRNAQLSAMAEHDVQEFRALLIDLLISKYPGRLGHLPSDYLERLGAVALAACAEIGVEQQGSIIEFAEALVKDDSHPMGDAALQARAQTVSLEFKSSQAFLKIQALRASFSGHNQDNQESDPADAADADPIAE